jgi:UDP-N-acetylmuramoyl-L-alanyl-D-glutamate--2,6-diaminopimelate ligase
MDDYFASKKILFAGCGTKEPRVAVLNVDDESGLQLVKCSKGRSAEVITYGLAKADFHVSKLEITPQGTRFNVITPDEMIPVASQLIGRVNVYNILAASAAAYARGCPSEAIAAGIRDCTRVPGRFERVDCGQPFTVVVDYAHTDDALRNLTALAREFVKPTNNRVITVFGCGGDRDRSKRPLMGEAAGKGSDFVVLTSDNPRSEDPLAIINDAIVGLQRSGTKYKTEPDRRAAIHLALSEARPGDIVLIAGKGHEQVQITNRGAVPFDDKRVAAEALHELGYDCGGSSKAEKSACSCLSRESQTYSMAPENLIRARSPPAIPSTHGLSGRVNSFLRSRAKKWTAMILSGRRWIGVRSRWLWRAGRLADFHRELA